MTTGQAIVTSVRNWTDSMDGIKHRTMNYKFPVDRDNYDSWADVPVCGSGYAAGDRFPLICLPSRPATAQPVAGAPRRPPRSPRL